MQPDPDTRQTGASGSASNDNKWPLPMLIMSHGRAHAHLLCPAVFSGAQPESLHEAANTLRVPFDVVDLIRVAQKRLQRCILAHFTDLDRPV